MLYATSNFLVPNGTFIVVLLAFLLVVGFIAKYVVPPLNAELAKRQDQIRGELEAADRAKADAEEADAERRTLLEAARAQARQIVDQASTTADQTVTAAQIRAQAEYDRIVQSADAEVTVARQAAVEEVTTKVGEIVLAAAERVLGREIQASDHRDLIDEAIAAVRVETEGTPAGAGSGRASNSGGSR
ncbi:MAG: F0F1 ATP synthase subunit B [Acidimicrobiales bacterium]